MPNGLFFLRDEMRLIMDIYTFSRPFSFIFSTSSSPPYLLSTCCARYHKSVLAWLSPQVYASFTDVLLYTSNKVQLRPQMEEHLCVASDQMVGRQNSDGIRSVLDHEKHHLKMTRLAQDVSHLLKQLKPLHQLLPWFPGVSTLTHRRDGSSSREGGTSPCHPFPTMF